jgi:hypothetical protein
MIVGEPVTTADYWRDRHLETWAAWKHAPDGPDGLPTEGCVGENYTSVDLDSDIAFEKLDSWIAMAVDAVVSDIGERHPTQRAALEQAYGIASLYRFPRENYDGLLAMAKAGVTVGLRRRGVWMGE